MCEGWICVFCFVWVGLVWFGLVCVCVGLCWVGLRSGILNSSCPLARRSLARSLAHLLGKWCSPQSQGTDQYRTSRSSPWKLTPSGSSFLSDNWCKLPHRSPRIFQLGSISSYLGSSWRRLPCIYLQGSFRSHSIQRRSTRQNCTCRTLGFHSRRFRECWKNDPHHSSHSQTLGCDPSPSPQSPSTFQTHIRCNLMPQYHQLTLSICQERRQCIRPKTQRKKLMSEKIWFALVLLAARFIFTNLSTVLLEGPRNTWLAATAACS